MILRTVWITILHFFVRVSRIILFQFLIDRFELCLVLVDINFDLVQEIFILLEQFNLHWSAIILNIFAEIIIRIEHKYIIHDILFNHAFNSFAMFHDIASPERAMV